MRIKSLLLTALISTTLGFQPAQAAEPIIVVSDTWENFVSEDGSGYYLDLLRMAFPSPKYELKLSILPYSRTLYTIKQQKADIVLGIWANEYNHSLLSKYPVEVDLYDAALRKEQPHISGIESFDKLRVIARVGYDLDGLLNDPMSYEEYTDIGSMVKMVQYNRADVLLDYAAELELAINLQELKGELIIQTNVLAEYAYFGFCSKPSCVELKQKFDQSFIKLHQEGLVEELLIENQQSTAALPPLKRLKNSILN